MKLGTTWEREDLGGGRVSHTQHMRPIAYDDNGIMRPINSNFVNGDEQYPHIITAARLMTSVAPDGGRRIHPTRELDRYLQIGAPYIKPAGSWTQVNLGAATRSANLLTWTTANANLYIQHAGHFIKLAILLKGGWQPPGGQFAFPVSLSGLTRSGNTLLADGVPVMMVRAPHVEDLDEPLDIRPIDSQFVQVNGQAYVLFTLPSLVGMSKPLIDPTLTLQPDATAGIDSVLDQANATTAGGTNGGWLVGSVSGGIKPRFAEVAQFDLSSITAGSAVSSATLTLTLYNASGTTNTHAIYRILAANSDWTEAGATWNTKDGSNAWAGGASGCSTSGTDHSATPLWSQANPSSTVGAVNFALDTTEFEAMLAANYGLVHKNITAGGDDYRLYRSSDYATAAQRPKLVVEYTLPSAGGGYRGQWTHLCPFGY